jgi:hypothetical protein
VRVIKKGLMFLALLGLASGIGRMAGSYWVGQHSNEAEAWAPLNKSLVSGVTTLANAAELDQEESAAPAQSGLVDEASAKCLECHGPFEELIAKPGTFAISDYKGDSKLNPHRYVPHKSKDIPACANCHEVHPVPPSSGAMMPAITCRPSKCARSAMKGVEYPSIEEYSREGDKPEIVVSY